MFYNKTGSKSTAVVLNSFVPFDRKIWNSEKAKSVRVRIQNCERFSQNSNYNKTKTPKVPLTV